MGRPADSKGFTVLDLLIRAAIVGAVGTVTVAAGGDLAPSASASAYVTNLSAVQKAVEAYKAEYGRYPDTGAMGESELTGPNGFLNRWPASSRYKISLDPVVPGRIDVTPPSKSRVA